MKIVIFVLAIVLFCTGCPGPRCRPHPTVGKNFIIVPPGAYVGGIRTDKRGCYMSEAFLKAAIKGIQEKCEIDSDPLTAF